jgi:hypothetical protein
MSNVGDDEIAVRQFRHQEFRQPGSLMKPDLPDQIIVALAGVACLCVLVFVGLSVSPAFAATWSRDANFSIMLSAARSLVYPLCAIKSWLPLFSGNKGARRIESFRCFDRWKEIA